MKISRDNLIDLGLILVVGVLCYKTFFGNQQVVVSEQSNGYTQLPQSTGHVNFPFLNDTFKAKGYDLNGVAMNSTEFRGALSRIRAELGLKPMDPACSIVDYVIETEMELRLRAQRKKVSIGPVPQNE